MPRGTAERRWNVGQKHLPIRLEPTLINRLKRLSKAVNAPINDTISIALDALERNRSMTEAVINGVENVALTVADRVEFLEKNLAALVNLIASQNEKMDDISPKAPQAIKSA
jgi:ABC-type transporter Mla subunit MlaD